MKKKRAPIAKLREVKKFSDEMLKQKGIHAKSSLIEEIRADARSPRLPGIPAYLPHAITLLTARRMMRDMIVLWRDAKVPNSKKNNATQFWIFMRTELRNLEKNYNTEISTRPEYVKVYEEIHKQTPTIGEVMKPLDKKQKLDGMRAFLIDSFATYISLFPKDDPNQYETVIFLNWFDEWTMALYQFWIKPEERK